MTDPAPDLLPPDTASPGPETIEAIPASTSALAEAATETPAEAQAEAGTTVITGIAAENPAVEAIENPEATPVPGTLTASPPQISRDPLHGVTLEMMLRELVHHQGWPAMAHRIPVRCFMFDPTITSSLRFLRKTPWARKKVEDLYRVMVTR